MARVGNNADLAELGMEVSPEITFSTSQGDCFIHSTSDAADDTSFCATARDAAECDTYRHNAAIYDECVDDCTVSRLCECGEQP